MSAIDWEPFRPIQPEDEIFPGRCATHDERGRCRRRREYISWAPGRRVFVACCAIHAGMKPTRRRRVPLEDPAYLAKLEREMAAFLDKGAL